MTTQQQDPQAEQMIGNRLEPVKVTRQEELQYGAAYAPLMRRLGMAVTQAEQALFQAENIAAGSHEADALHGVPEGAERDEHGRSPHTAWADSVADRLGQLRTLAYDLYADVAVECIQRERATRKPGSTPVNAPEAAGG